MRLVVGSVLVLCLVGCCGVPPKVCVTVDTSNVRDPEQVGAKVTVSF